jgi:pSer/pThr/pTyr-binding forkhead associated (FHA) protein
MGGVTLQVLDGADRGRIFENLIPTITIGREEGNTIQLNDERVSRFHLKIQDDQSQFVLTDLESTNGTKVNGEDIHLRILRFGDMIAVGRSVILFGSREQIAERLAKLRGGEVPPERTVDADEESDQPPQAKASLDFEINWGEGGELPGQSTLHSLLPPELPARLSPGQAAQLCEMLEYLHIRIRDLLASVRVDDKSEQAMLEQRQWQNLLDLQGRLAIYLRSIAEPHD